METKRYREFFQSKVDLGRQMIKLGGDIVEPDAEIILCCAVSGLATLLWPGNGIDRQRFIQLLVDFSQPPTDLRIISTPMLAEQLKADGHPSLAVDLKFKFFPGLPSEILNPRTVDRTDAEVSAFLTSLDLKRIRLASYAAIIYIDLRCALVHEYSLAANLTTLNLFEVKDSPSYTNITMEDGTGRKQFHLPFDYLATALTSVLEGLFTFWESVSTLERPRPAKWWIDG